MTQHEQNMLLIATAVLKAQALKEATYVEPEKDSRGHYTSNGHYTLDMRDAVRQVWSDPIFRPMLHLIASSQFCDFGEWAMEVVCRFDPNSNLLPKGFKPTPNYFD